MSDFIVSARKYRPARFDEVVGQEHVSGTLKNAFQQNHLAHAFLFTGPRGVGKTTCARILAKVLNCENITKDYEACNECGSCTAFNDNASFNITELDAASNNSVEHIRALIEQVRFQPQQGKYKVFIIDEVHMLSQQAFNAFLKTLEEPPPYAIFILATTEKHKIIPTILSRCQIFDFRRIQVQAMVQHLEGICKTEGIEAERDALHIIAQKADGALRDSLSIFDRIVSFSGKKIIYQDVIDNLNVLDYDYFFKIVDAMLTEDIAKVMLTFNDILTKGFEPDIFINGLAEHLRNLMVSKDPQTLSLLEVSDGLKDRYQQQATISPTAYLLTALNIANDCDVNYKMARNKRLHVEMAIIKMTYILRAVDLASNPPVNTAPAPTANRTAQLSTAAATPVKIKEEAKTVTPPSTPTPQKAPIAPKAKAPVIKKDITAKLNIDSKYNTPKIFSLDKLEEEVEDYDAAQEDEESKLTIENLTKAWKEFAESVQSPTVRNTLRGTDLTIEDNQVVATVATRMAKEMIQQETELMPYIRKQLSSKRLALKTVIDSSKAPKQEPVAKSKQLLTNKEKFDAMKEVNPLVDRLRTLFDLHTDNS